MEDPSLLRARAEALLLDVERVFGGADPPSRADLLEPQEREIDRESAEECAQQFAGRRWEDLDRPWVKRNWSSYCYLSPTAWAYYVPAVVRDALRRLADRRSMKRDGEGRVQVDHDVDTAVGMLGPAYAWQVWEEGRDDRLETRIATLDPEQYDTLCRFLALVHEVSPDYGVSWAVEWSWELRGAPVLDPVRAQIETEAARLFDHTWPEHPDPAVRALVARIEQAFSHRPRPGDEDLLGDGVGDDPYRAALWFRGRDRRRLHPDALHPDALYGLGDAGLCYVLPAYLIAELHGHQRWVSMADLLAEAGDPEDDSWPERLRDLTGEECAAIAAFLRHRLETDDGEFFDDERTRIEAALERYWTPRAAQ